MIGFYHSSARAWPQILFVIVALSKLHGNVILFY